MAWRAASGKPNLLGSGGSLVTKLKLKELADRHHYKWSLWRNWAQHGKPHQSQTSGGLRTLS